ncbi:MBL fold metallo-hydrolase [Undibacterium sp. Di27W]|uniref:MBL fold metallo-hydrolase n=1 Tax=Undibacterium sp. Di27W TaxID=3413036 RepID=UPI003BF3AD21
MQLSRPLFSGAFYSTALAALISLAGLAPVAQAAAPLASIATPGFYRSMLGDFEITVLSDGTFPFPAAQMLTNTSQEKVNKALAKSHLSSPVITSVNGFLINTGNKLVLIDTGCGKFFGPSLGKLLSNLQAAGYQAEQVDEIYLSHLHPDHIGGLGEGDKAVFPNAIVRVDRQDAEHWLNPANMARAPKEIQAYYERASKVLQPYVEANRLKTFDGNSELLPGIKAIASHGHTAGHSIFKLESKGQTLVLWGDLMHVAAVQFETPAVAIQFEENSKFATLQRQKAYADAAQHAYLVGAAHLSFPALGYVRKEGKGYAWMPLNHAPLP